MTLEEAQIKLEEELSDITTQITIKSDDLSFQMNSSDFSEYDIPKTAKNAFEYGKKHGIFVKSFTYLKSLLFKTKLPIETIINDELLIEKLNVLKENKPNLYVETTYKIDGENLVITTGRSGKNIDFDDVKSRIEKAVKYAKEETIDVVLKDKELENMLEDIAGETNTYQKQIMELDYEVALSAYNEYVAEQTEYIKELEATLNMYTQEAGEIYVTAPHSGIFSKSSANYTTGNTIGSEDVLGVISSFEEVLIEVPSRSAAAFNFGRTVEIKFTSTTPAITLQGKVISAPNILYNANSVSVTIAITSAFPEATTMSSSARNNASVVVTTDYVQDGIIIPSSALSNAKGNIGVVSVLENGTLVKRNVKYGYKGSNYAWILEGLEVGELVTTK